MHIGCFPTLKFGIQWQRTKPHLQRIAERPHRCTRVAKQQPPPLAIMREHFCNPIRPTCEQFGAEPWFERLYRCAGLEPDNAVRERHAENCRPRSLVRRFDWPDRVDVRPNPPLGLAPSEHTVNVTGCWRRCSGPLRDSDRRRSGVRRSAGSVSGRTPRPGQCSADWRSD